MRSNFVKWSSEPFANIIVCSALFLCAMTLAEQSDQNHITLMAHLNKQRNSGPQESFCAEMIDACASNYAHHRGSENRARMHCARR